MLASIPSQHLESLFRPVGNPKSRFSPVGLCSRAQSEQMESSNHRRPRASAGLSGENGPRAELASETRFHRHGRPCAGHPRLSAPRKKTWMRRTSPRMTTLDCFPHQGDSSQGQKNFPRTALRVSGDPGQATCGCPGPRLSPGKRRCFHLFGFGSSASAGLSRHRSLPSARGRGASLCPRGTR